MSFCAISHMSVEFGSGFFANGHPNRGNSGSADA
jgi:hypothetical protein